MFTRAVEEEGVEGFCGAVIGEVVESVAVGGGEEGKGRAVTLWFVCASLFASWGVVGRGLMLI